MTIPAMALLQQHDAGRHILIEPAARRRPAIEARGHSELGAFETGSVRNWGAQSGRKNQPAYVRNSQLGTTFGGHSELGAFGPGGAIGP